MSTEKTRAEMVDIVAETISRFSFDMVEKLAKIAENDGALMEALAKRADDVGAAEACAELFFALVMTEAGTFGPTQVCLAPHAVATFSEQSKRRAQAGARSVKRFAIFAAYED